MSCSTPRHLEAIGAVVGVPADAALRERTAAWIARRPRAEVVAALVVARVPVAPVNDLADLLADPQVVCRQSVVEVDGLLVAAPAPRVDGGAPARRPPALGDANDDVLRDELGLADDDIDELRRVEVIA